MYIIYSHFQQMIFEDLQFSITALGDMVYTLFSYIKIIPDLLNLHSVDNSKQ